MKACMGVDVQLQPFLNSALDEASSQVQARTHRIGGFVDPSVSLEI
jgi:hypothetical protein